MIKMICFDMDGTIADLFGVKDWIEKIDTEDPSPYIEAAPLWDMVALNTILNELVETGYEIRIISWLAKHGSKEYGDKVRQAKLDWLKKYNFPYHTAHLVKYGTTKADCVRRYRPDAILIDDNARVRKGWTLGETIDPLEVDIIDYLKSLLEEI